MWEQYKKAASGYAPSLAACVCTKNWRLTQHSPEKGYSTAVGNSAAGVAARALRAEALVVGKLHRDSRTK